jgi:DNA-binding winged helix-turn-helix (wHTH) protein
LDDPPSIYFGRFALDRRAGRLLNGDAEIRLRPKTWAVLVYLAERPGVLLSIDEILDAVWANVNITPDTLNKSIGELRRALGDDPSQPVFIETVG